VRGLDGSFEGSHEIGDLSRLRRRRSLERLLVQLRIDERQHRLSVVIVIARGIE
jgi:hypothetical protein